MNRWWKPERWREMGIEERIEEFEGRFDLNTPQNRKEIGAKIVLYKPVKN